MTLPISHSRARFTELAQILLRLLQRLHHNLGLFQAHPEAAYLEQAMTAVGQMEKMVSQLSLMQTSTLFEEEYTVFCDLIICGNEMSSYLVNSQSASQTLRKHASHWQKLAQTFKPFFEGVLVNSTASCSGGEHHLK